MYIDFTACYKIKLSFSLLYEEIFPPERYYIFAEVTKIVSDILYSGFIPKLFDFFNEIYLRYRGVQLILAYSWARPAILVAGKGRG